MRPFVKPGGVRLTPHELRYVFLRHDIRQAVSWQLGHLVAVLLGAFTFWASPWVLGLVVAFYAFTAVRAYRRWRAMEREGEP